MHAGQPNMEGVDKAGMVQYSEKEVGDVGVWETSAEISEDLFQAFW